MTFEQVKEDAFDGLGRLQWLLLHAKAADVAKIDMERYVATACAQVAMALRITTDSAALASNMLVAHERDRLTEVVMLANLDEETRARLLAAIGEVA